MVCRRLCQLRDDGCNAELGELRGSLLRRFTKRRNGPTLQARQSGNLPFNFGGMIKRSMPPCFKAPCSLWRAFAVVAKTTAFPCSSWMRHLGTFLFCRQLGTLLAPALHRMLGKIRAGIWPNSGSRFPDGVGCGKCDPEYCSETGCRFPDKAQPESASHSEAAKRDALSARQNLSSRVERQPRYSPRISAESSSWVSTT